MSGHSKWHQIRHKKALTDAKRGQLFSKLVKEIMIAVKSGGPSPDTNARLRSALERARTEGLPKVNMERAISRASGGGDASSLQEFLYEASAGGGIAILIEGITDNKNRTIAEIKKILNEYGARLAESGSLSWNFEKIGTIQFNSLENQNYSSEDLENIIIESGAQNFKTEQEIWIVETVFAELERVRSELERHGIKVREVGHDYKPKTTMDPPADSRPALENLLDALTEHDDVQEVYANTNN